MKNKIINLVVTVASVFTCISPVFALETGNDIQMFSEPQETESADKVTEESVSAEETNNIVSTDNSPQEQSSNIDQCFISAFEIDVKKDGTSPFDKDDAQGNDSGDSNGIVRTFDSANYTLKYTTAIKDSGNAGVDSGNVMVEFNLPCEPYVAAFNKDSMQWCLDMVTTYIYSDGTESTTWDQSKSVINQKVTGRRFLQNTASQNVIPGTGTLSVTVDVKMAKNNEIITPSFSLWMEGNSEEEVKSLNDSVTVTAIPLYDVHLKRTSTGSILGWYNERLGQAYSSKTNEDDVYGRLEGYSVSLRLKNISTEKGKKGLELPYGTITFDIKLNAKLNGKDATYTEGYQPFLWDYKMNMNNQNNGALNRDMTPLGQTSIAYDSWQSGVPYNKGNNKYSCFNGGQMEIQPDENDTTLLHVSVTDYQFDLINFTFPDRDSSDQVATFTNDIGYFSVGFLQAICQFPTEVDSSENLYFETEASNFKASSISGATVTNEADLTNNKAGATIALFPKGSHSKRNFFYNEKGATIAVPWHEGNAYLAAGSNMRIISQMIYAGDSYLTATNILQKFDDSSIRLPENTTSYTYKSKVNPETEWGPIKVLFAAKPDKTGWKNEDEMNNTREENLIYFETVSDLYKAGYTCVGYLYEVRDSKLFPNNGGGGISFQMLANIPDDIPAGTVTWTKNDVRSWNTKDTMSQSWTDVKYDESIKAYGLGDSSWKEGEFAENYTKPSYTDYKNYKKTEYENGVIVGGHTNSYYGGNSLLIISDKVSVSITPIEQESENIKNIYDLDMGERTAFFKISPSISSDVSNANITDSVTITATLPEDLHFNSTGVSLTPAEVVKNSDNTTTVKWVIENIKVNDGIPPVYFSTTIGEEGTKNDVLNNQTLPVTATITSVNDNRDIRTDNGKKAETSISVIKLASSSVTKKTLNPLIELGADFTFRLRFSNLSETISVNNEIYDILPYSHDSYGSLFSGKYNVKYIELDYSNAPMTKEENPHPLLNHSDNPKAATEEIMEDALNSHAYSSDLFTTKQGNAESEKIKWDINKPLSAFGLSIGNLYGNEYIDIYIHCTSLDPEGNYIADSDGKTQQPGDIYRNRFYQDSDNQAATVISNIVETKVVSRAISGVIWMDENKNGIREAEETANSKLSVSLYRKTPSSFAEENNGTIEVNGTTLYPAYTTTGHIVQKKLTNTDGTYEFTNLESGDYIVMLSGVNNYGLTKKDAGDNDDIDSEGMLNGNVKDDKFAFISDIALPLIENMTTSEFISEHNDAGLIPGETKEVSIEKIWDDGNNYDGSRPEEIEVTLINADGTKQIKSISEKDGWIQHFGTEQYYKGRENEFDFSEKHVPFYSAVFSEKQDGNYTLTNTHYPMVILRTGGAGLIVFLLISGATGIVAFALYKMRKAENDTGK